ncbi:hypothetical protein HPHPH24C_1551 [Helicobacter pylori Hp H-24c]|nr:hypothetical protein HPHPH24C_1551 [Helicobacter pylori Hp H-24c]EJC36275.1 hypothetical protein HPHPM1_1721 [Helicobacter pylori Hp M1]
MVIKELDFNQMMRLNAFNHDQIKPTHPNHQQEIKNKKQNKQEIKDKIKIRLKKIKPNDQTPLNPLKK